VLPEAILHAGVFLDVLLLAACAAILILGLWTLRHPATFWEQFNPYLRPYGRFTLVLGRMIGSLWACGAALGCILFIGNAVKAGLDHRWIR
jgi:hypothetical protein